MGSSSVTIGSFKSFAARCILVRERTQESGVHSNEPLPILLRYREAARELGVCERQIHNLVDQNLLEKVKLGSKTARITRSSVLRLAAQRATESPTAA
jgi:hypothetical protein